VAHPRIPDRPPLMTIRYDRLESEQKVEELAARRLAWRNLFRARLSRRIVLSVFASIVLIEAVILLPSIERRQQELLVQLKEISAAETSGALRMLPAGTTDQQVLSRLRQSILNPKILGGALYRPDGAQVGTFGEMPQLNFAAVQANPNVTLYQPALFEIPARGRYDAAWAIAPLKGQYVLIIRHNAASVQQEIVAFVERITGLVLVISIFVTVATLFVLEPLLITPIMLLRKDLLNAGAAILQDQTPPPFESLGTQRQDELGDVIAAFSQMYRQVSEAIAQRKQAESALASLAEVGELSAMIVHEIRNPLTTVLMGLQSFKKLNLPDVSQLRLSLALEEADRLQRLLNEILNYTKCQTLNVSELDLNRLTGEMLDTLRDMPSAQGKYIQLTSTDTPIIIWGDKDKLKQAFINLIVNACEAASENETVTWNIKPELKDICITVHNNGEPIPGDKIAQITQPFFTTKPTGNGLGLAIVKRIVEAHGGTLAIESNALMGTLVEMKIPIRVRAQ
jgi:signal transduction histidine kinase